ncbi:hypothetical protein HAX54_011616 [Datura stramonium]|uniref:Uncharacterized protein n=1 Tax=Datura stramonium TaxID=4076 RepID=A0ABS8TIG0_DATST|nr:hypothetical protein [Datura stramonium]
MELSMLPPSTSQYICQFSIRSKLDQPSRKGRSGTVENPKGNGRGSNGHCMDIVTESGKMLQSDIDNSCEIDVDECGEEESKMDGEVRMKQLLDFASEEAMMVLKKKEKVKENVIDIAKSYPKPLLPFPRRLAKKSFYAKIGKGYLMPRSCGNISVIGDVDGGKDPNQLGRLVHGTQEIESKKQMCEPLPLWLQGKEVGEEVPS